MSILEIISTLLHRKWIVLVTVALAIVIAVVGSLLMPRVYTATSTVRILSAPNPITDRPNQFYADRLMNTYMVIARSSPMLEKVIAAEDLSIGVSQLRRSIDVTPIEETELMRIAVSHGNPDEAARIANSLAEILISDGSTSTTPLIASETILQQINQVQQEIEELNSEYDRLLIDSPEQSARINEVGREAVVKQEIYETLLEQYDQARLQEALNRNAILLVEPATLPTNPTSPRLTINVALAAMFGLLGGVGLSLLLQNINRTLYTTEQVQLLTDLPILARIPHLPKPDVTQQLTGAQLEAFRHLRTNVLSLTDGSAPRTIMLVSAGDGEGKSTILSYFAISLARTGRSILILDADLRKPSQHTFFGVKNKAGLTELLRGETNVKATIQRTDIPNLSLLPAGQVSDDAAELLSGENIAKLVDGLKSLYDVVLIDTAPVLPVADTAIIAPHIDSVIQVVRSGYSRAVMTLATADQITDIHLRPIGIVLNDVSQTESSYYTVISS